MYCKHRRLPHQIYPQEAGLRTFLGCAVIKLPTPPIYVSLHPPIRSSRPTSSQLLATTNVDPLKWVYTNLFLRLSNLLASVFFRDQSLRPARCHHFDRSCTFHFFRARGPCRPALHLVVSAPPSQLLRKRCLGYGLVISAMPDILWERPADASMTVTSFAVELLSTRSLGR